MKSRIRKTALYGVAVLIALASLQGTAFANNVAVPEIDGGTAASALGLLTSGVMILRSRLSRKGNTK